jgi:hypothetical protein
MLLLGGLGIAIVPGCVIRIGTGSGDGEEADLGGGATTGEGTSGEATDPGGGALTPEEERALFLSEVDQQELALVATKASFGAAYAMGMVESLGVDPATLDDAALADLVAQYMPLAAEEADKWVATLDPAMLAKGIPTEYECADVGCEMLSYCKHGYTPPVVHRCYVTGCGDAGCKLCPPYVGDLLKHLVFKQWCSYVCAQHPSSPIKIVAWGAGFVPMFGNGMGGPVCMEQATLP